MTGGGAWRWGMRGILQWDKGTLNDGRRAGQGGGACGALHKRIEAK